jgi:hypothetical protein
MNAESLLTISHGAGKSISGLPPTLAVIPDPDDQFLPIIPELAEKPRLALVRSLMRQAVAAYWGKCYTSLYLGNN